MSVRAHPQGAACATERGVAARDLAFTEREFAVLQIARHYFASFAAPESQGWMRAIVAALDAFDHDTGPHVAVAVLSVVQTMRQTRKTPFRFNTPGCALCSGYLTVSERVLMNAVRCAATARAEAAHAHASFMCDGNDVRALMRALDALADAAFRTGGEARADPETGHPTRVAGD